MKRVLVLLFVACYLLFGGMGAVFSQNRYATCDLCGYCPPAAPPANWDSCRSCLYPSASSDPFQGETLLIDPTTQQPPKPVPGSWYTMIGCVNTDLGGFQNPGAAGNIVQVLLNLIFASAGVIALIYFIYGSFLVLTSQAEPEKLGQGKRIIMGAIVGVIFTLASVFLVNLVGGVILKIPGF